MFVAGAVYVFMDFAADAQVSGMVPTSLGGWSVGHMFTFLINLLFWEALLIGIPLVITIVAIYMLWWKSLPLHEREPPPSGTGTRLPVAVISILPAYSLSFLETLFLPRSTRSSRRFWMGKRILFSLRSLRLCGSFLLFTFYF